MSKDEKITSVYMRLRSRLARAVLGIAPPSEIEDIIQETYVRACQASRQATIKQPRAYLFRVARNLALDHVKRAETRLAVSREEVGEGAIVEAAQLRDATLDGAVSSNDFTAFCEAVRRLPQQQRRAFVLKKVYGYSQREIASEMQLSEKTVERHIALGMARCMDYLSTSGKLAIGGKSSAGGRVASRKPRTGDKR